MENSNLASTYFHYEVDPRKLVRWRVELFASQNGLCVVNFRCFFFKVYFFWWGVWILSEEILKLNWTPKKLNVHEWLIWVIFTWKSSDLYASQNGLCLMNFSEFFFQSELFLVGNPNFVWTKFKIEVDPRRTQCARVTHLSDFQVKISSMSMTDSYEWFSVENHLHVCKELIWRIFRDLPGNRTRVAGSGTQCAIHCATRPVDREGRWYLKSYFK